MDGVKDLGVKMQIFSNFEISNQMYFFCFIFILVAYIFTIYTKFAHKFYSSFYTIIIYHFVDFSRFFYPHTNIFNINAEK